MAVSNAPGTDDNLLNTFDHDNEKDFKQFSGDRIFCPVDTPFYTSTFEVSASDDKASTSAYGVVALDVDQTDEASLKFKDKSGWVFKTVDFKGIWGSKTFSFAGIVCDEPAIASVDVHLGKKLFDACIDDVFFAEPTKVW